MKQETRLFFDYILRENRPLGEFLDARYTFLNERLAKHYGIEGVTGTGVPQGGADHRSARRHPEPRQRADGFQLSHAHLGGDPRQVHPAEHPGQPAAAAARRTFRRWTKPPWARPRRCASRWRSTAPTPTCASCHNKMDPLGFGLENYDGIGKWRTMDGKFPVDSSGHAAQRQDLRHARRNARRAEEPAAAVLPLHRGEDVDILVGQGTGRVRPAHGG